MHSRSYIQDQILPYQQSLASQLVTAVIILNAELTIVYANPAAEALLNKSLYRLYGISSEVIFANTSISTSRLKQLLTTGQEFTDSDIVVELNPHHRFTAEVTASSVEFNKRPHVLLELKQIDQQKQISLEVFQHQQWLAARDLIKGLAHEIKNPLGGLRGAAQLLGREVSNDQQEYTSMIIEQADRLTNLVDRLLGPNQLPQVQAQNIHGILEKVCKLVSYSNEKKVHLMRDYDPSLPAVECDQEKLQQAVLNIVNNAIQAIDESNTITLKTRIASNKTIYGKRIKLAVLISIIDNGPGIPNDIQDTLFYPMVSGRSNGTGLGLSISQTLINQHQGKLSCHSRPGHTEFTILLPLKPQVSKQQPLNQALLSEENKL
ncbi:nitrogen regulation protein NR(II) [Colwellia sp. E2M01]|uniref:nitrogen regulation protein NR(II) n=1 Tax=Colwellia sp. E2M01 TaxID=2841561 RepID=UPI001C09ADEE|nr:nitrogen regulation protein NR(II) [Colwellia sp. E2M01]MBU2871440.1 nitrogen regulation protein NR(II) [Colwellia sp. E2M01]